MENPQQPTNDRDISIANYNATVSNLAVNLIILAHIQEQISLTKQTMEENRKFQRELLAAMDVMILNQNLGGKNNA